MERVLLHLPLSFYLREIMHVCMYINKIWGGVRHFLDKNEYKVYLLFYNSHWVENWHSLTGTPEK